MQDAGRAKGGRSKRTGGEASKEGKPRKGTGEEGWVGRRTTLLAHTFRHRPTFLVFFALGSSPFWFSNLRVFEASGTAGEVTTERYLLFETA